MSLKQLTLDLVPNEEATFDNFVIGENHEVVEMLSAWSRESASDRFIYLWGEAGCGKTHLMKSSLVAAAEQGFVTCYLQDDLLLEVEADSLPENAYVAVDDVTRLNPSQQIAIFALYNRLKEGGGAMLTSGPLPSAQLDLRDDLVTRLGWGLSYRVNGLSDEQKSLALQHYAKEKGFDLTPEMVDYMLIHYRRDLPSLLQLLSQLDQLSLSLKRPITLSFVRQVLQRRVEVDQNPKQEDMLIFS
ncbi:DnaA regulatory inactivator Hda [Leeia sp. TBRC 13508]|uniref:DnaA regulatory inactivator Hda n=1 Tax=Leeia speluncae TaxID=2884804 RepID=A0ABS8D4G9_9NEIS|nr:DnaA regulatory inactivator Hda [Leeia speluncae]MCB6182538.1 DnaA regulatory inactivator Hda [Leeia speluncae]